MKFIDYILPSKKNKYHPLILQPIGLGIIALAIALLPPTYNITTAKSFQVLGYATNVNVTDLYTLTNAERSNAGVAGLTLDSQLNNAAYAKAQHMFQNNYWAHNAPDGTTPWDFILGAGYQYVAAGENLAKGFNTSSGVMNGWMNSPSHKDNVLQTAFTDVGFAAVNGTLQGEETTLVVAMYGSRTVQPVSSPSQAPTQTVQTQSTPQPTPQTTPTTAQPAETPVETAPIATDTPAEPTEQAPSVANDNVTSTDETVKAALQKEQQSSAEPSDLMGVVAGAITKPVKAYTAMNWGQKATLLILWSLILVLILKHTMIWRMRERGLKHIWLRAHPIGQASLLVVATIITLANSLGVII
ncbi:MAG: hypothetical protein JWN33_493 [Candidatus Saccharibacteria bacterium]|nr:hypothetical protein [Candidatus Saccharibacteria bacterium]